MNDRELLELAAKAAGYWLADDGMCATGVDTPFVRWNPLTDDGDALRLAVKLGLVIDCGGPSAGQPFKIHKIWLNKSMTTEELTRRAIVRAAAEIGKAM